jgi:hypothetical protein
VPHVVYSLKSTAYSISAFLFTLLHRKFSINVILMWWRSCLARNSCVSVRFVFTSYSSFTFTIYSKKNLRKCITGSYLTLNDCHTTHTFSKHLILKQKCKSIVWKNEPALAEDQCFWLHHELIAAWQAEEPGNLQPKMK